MNYSYINILIYLSILPKKYDLSWYSLLVISPSHMLAIDTTYEVWVVRIQVHSILDCDNTSLMTKRRQMPQMFFRTGTHLGNPLPTVFKELFIPFFLACNTMSLLHMIALCSKSLRYQVTKVHWSIISINALMVRDDTHNSRQWYWQVFSVMSEN